MFSANGPAKPAKPQITLQVKGAKNLSLLPIVGYTPANGFVIGGAISVTEFLGDRQYEFIICIDQCFADNQESASFKFKI